MLRRTFVGVLLALGLMVGTAQAGPIDFTSLAWSGAAGQTSYFVNYGGLIVTVTSSVTKGLTFNSAGPCSGIPGLACLGDGLGIVDVDDL